MCEAQHRTGESGEERKEETEASTRREIVAFACDTISSNSSSMFSRYETDRFMMIKTSRLNRTGKVQRETEHVMARLGTLSQ